MDLHINLDPTVIAYLCITLVVCTVVVSLTWHSVRTRS